MTNLKKWDYISHIYKPFDTPAVFPALYRDNLEDLVDCANCGRELPFGDTYTSKTIHNDVGFGYGVCEQCYEEELKEYKKHEQR